MRNEEIQVRGFAITRNVLTSGEVKELVLGLGRGDSAGRRGMLSHPVAGPLALSDRFLDLVRPHLPGPPRPVRAIFFDKSPEVNWLVPWHQDLSIAVRERIEVSGFGPWSLKDGLIHVQPPVEWLEAMVTIRLHLDETDASNGALRVIPGSHRSGKLGPSGIARIRENVAEEVVEAGPGEVLLMRPLLLHASGRSTSDRPRRVLHIEYAGLDLPEGLEWNPSA
jgi:hypothetical protein